MRRSPAIVYPGHFQVNHPQYIVLATILVVTLSLCVRVEPKSCDAARGLEYDKLLMEKLCK